MGIIKMQNEITQPSDLLDEYGELIQKGWARKPILNFNRNNIKSGPLRIKEWDYYAILHPNYGVAFTIADLGYAGLIACVWLDFKKKTFIQDENLVWFTKGKFNMPKTSEEGDIKLNEKGITLSFEKRWDLRGIYFGFPGFNNGLGLEAKLSLTQNPNLDTMVIATPWKKKPTKFYYNQKINCMPAEGTVQVGSEIYEFNKDKCFGVLDWGRGVWTYKNRWYWGSASGKLKDGTYIGWNLGYGFSDRSYASENLIFYNGVGHKIDQVKFHINKKNYLENWQFKSNDGRFEMIMEPIIDRNSKFNYGIIKSIQHQVFGYYSGHLILDNGKKIEVDRVLGFAEDVFNKW